MSDTIQKALIEKVERLEKELDLERALADQMSGLMIGLRTQISNWGEKLPDNISCYVSDIDDALKFFRSLRP